MTSPSFPVSKTLAEFASDTAFGDIPIATRKIIGLSAFDWAGCGIAGVGEPVSQVVRKTITSENGGSEARLFGGGWAPTRAAALLNGATSHALDYDDTHFGHIGHPSVVVFSAALAMAQKLTASGTEFLTAATIGFEASIRVGQWLGRGHYQAGFHQTATAGSIGATLAVGKLLSLSKDQMQHALGIISTRASGLKNQFGTMGKPYNAGLAAANAVEAGMLAAGGFISNPTGLEGAQGFVETHHGAGETRAFEGLGQSYVLDDVSYKFHACCHGTHAAIEALLLLVPQINNTQDITAINIRTNPRWMTVCDIQNPVSGLEAKFSYTVIAALVLSGKKTGDVRNFSGEMLTDPDIQRLQSQTCVTADLEISETSAVVDISFKNANSLTAKFDLMAPMSFENKQTRLKEKSAILAGKTLSLSLWDAVEGLKDADHVEDFAKVLAG